MTDIAIAVGAFFVGAATGAVCLVMYLWWGWDE